MLDRIFTLKDYQFIIKEEIFVIIRAVNSYLIIQFLILVIGINCMN